MKNNDSFDSVTKYWYLWLILIIFIFTNIYLAVMSWQDIRDSIGWVKNIPQKTEFKIRHIVQFSPQAFFFSFTFERTFNLSAKKSAIIAIIILALTGIISETIQYFTPSRIASLMDVFWNIFASVLGAYLFIIFRKLKKRPNCDP